MKEDQMATPVLTAHPLVPKQPKRVVVSLAVNFELNTTNGLRRVVFGLEKDTKGSDVQWQIHFTLFERAKRTDPFGDPVVKLDVNVDTTLAVNAEAMAHSKPTPEQAAEIIGPVSEDAKAAKADPSTKPDFDESAQTVLG
jgi:hypothetical protein